MPAFRGTSLALTGHGMKWNWDSGERCDHGARSSFQVGKGQDSLPQAGGSMVNICHTQPGQRWTSVGRSLGSAKLRYLRCHSLE